MSITDKIRPLHDRVVVKRLDAEEKTASGIIIPDSGQEKPQQGEIIAIGKGALKDDGSIRPMDVKAGDTVLFGKWAATEVKLDGTEYLVMKEDDIIAVLTK